MNDENKFIIKTTKKIKNEERIKSNMNNNKEKMWIKRLMIEKKRKGDEIKKQ